VEKCKRSSLLILTVVWCTGGYLKKQKSSCILLSFRASSLEESTVVQATKSCCRERTARCGLHPREYSMCNLIGTP